MGWKIVSNMLWIMWPWLAFLEQGYKKTCCYDPLVFGYASGSLQDVIAQYKPIALNKMGCLVHILQQQ